MIAALCVIAYLSMSYIYVFLIPATNAWHDEPAFAGRVMARLGASNTHLGLFQPFGVLGPLFYMDSPRPLPAFYEASQLEAAVADGRIRWVLVRRKDIPAGIEGTIGTGQPSFPFHAPDHPPHQAPLNPVARNPGP